MKQALITVLLFVSMYGGALAQSVKTPDNMVRFDYFVVEENRAVIEAIAQGGSLPSKWAPKVRDLVFAGKANWSVCKAVHVRFSGLDAGNIPQGKYRALHVRPNPDTKGLSQITGESSATMVHTGSPTSFYHDMVVPLQGGNALVYLPAAPFRQARDPIAQLTIPGEEVQGLPAGAVKQTSTPRNPARGTHNSLKGAWDNPSHQRGSVVVVDPGACK